MPNIGKTGNGLQIFPHRCFTGVLSIHPQMGKLLLQLGASITNSTSLIARYQCGWSGFHEASLCLRERAQWGREAGRRAGRERKGDPSFFSYMSNNVMMILLWSLCESPTPMMLSKPDGLQSLRLQGVSTSAFYEGKHSVTYTLLLPLPKPCPSFMLPAVLTRSRVNSKA